VSRIQIVSILAMAGLLGLVFDLVRRRRLMEGYALLWLLSAVTLLTLAVWRNLLDLFAHAIGVFYAPSALFAVTLAVTLLLLLHFSLVISRLSDQNKVLAQRLGILEHDLDELRAPRPEGSERPAEIEHDIPAGLRRVAD